MILLASTPDTTVNLRTEVNQFLFVTLFLIVYFSIASMLYLTQIKIEFKNYWRFLSSLSVWLFGIAIGTYALGNAFYQSFPFIRILITLMTFFYYLRRKKRYLLQS